MRSGGEFCIFDSCYEWGGDPLDWIEAGAEITGDTYVQGIGGALYDAYVAPDDGVENLAQNFFFPVRVAAAVVGGTTGAGCGGGSAESTGAGKADAPPVIVSNVVSLEEREFLSNRDFNKLASDGVEDYMDDHLGTCIPNFDQDAFDFWCYGIMGGRIFDDREAWWQRKLTHDDGVCSAWRVYNPDNSNPVCGEGMLATDEWWSFTDATSRTDLTDDNDDVFYVLREMERRNNWGVPSIAWWTGDLVQASKCFAEPAKIWRTVPEIRDEFRQLFQTTFTKDFTAPTPQEQALTDSITNSTYQFVMAIRQVFDILRTPNLTPEQIQEQIDAVATGMEQLTENVARLIAELHRENPTMTDLVEQEIFFEIAATGAHYDIDKLEFGTEWKALDETRSHRSDWVTPLIHAGTLYFQAVNLYTKRYEDLLKKIDDGEYEVIEDENSDLFIVMHDVRGADGMPAQISVTDYANDYIWRKPGEQTETVRTALLAEINAAVVRSKERCYGCTDEHYWARLLIEYIDKMNNGIWYDLWPRDDVIDLEELRRRVRTPHTTTAEECCHANPPTFLDDTTHECSTVMNAYEWCYSMQPPRMFDEANCACSQDAGAQICLNMLPIGTRIFVFDQTTRTSECVPCEEPTPITRDGLTCIARPQRRNPPVVHTETVIEEPPPAIANGGRGVTNPWQVTNPQ